MPEKDNQLNFEAIKLSAVNTLKRGLAVAGSVIAMSGAILEHEAVFPAVAQAEQQCTTETTTTTTTNPDGTTITTTSETTHCTDTDQDPQPPQNTKPPKDQPSNGEHPHKPHHHKPKHHQKPEPDFPIGFVNYNQQDWRAPSTGCGPTSIAMVLATLEGNHKITPNTVTSKISPEWYDPGNTGTEAGAFFAMGHNYDLAVRETGLKSAKKVLQAGGLAIVHAARGSGHFTMNGHYMVLKRVDEHGRFRIADPNGNGYSHDSERRSWSISSLKANGIDDVWTFRKKN